MRFTAAVALVAVANASYYSSYYRDQNPVYAKCDFVRNRDSGAPRVRPRGYIVADQSLPADAVNLHIQIDNLSDSTAYTVDILSLADGTSSINKYTCAESVAAGTVTAPAIAADDVFSVSSDSRGDLPYTAATSTDFKLHRDTGVADSRSLLLEDQLFAGVYDDTNTLVACCEFYDLRSSRLFEFYRKRAGYVA